MELLYSKIKPCDYNDHSSFGEVFELGIVNSDLIKIATGYISEESILELKSVLSFYNEEQNSKQCSFLIGMHGREGFTKAQYDAAIELATFLRDNQLGTVSVCTAFKFHGKTYVFIKEDTCISALLGSSNLSNILDNRQWELDALVSESAIVSELNSLHDDLVAKASVNILEWPKPETFIETSDLLKDRIDVVKAEREEYEQIENTLTERVFDLPLKIEAKSNLNTYFGKGRLQQNGVIRPRHWYEVELIVPIEITSADGYPSRDSILDVYTDDGWRFKCKVQGDYGKNFRSEGDLKTLGRWIKGRLERAGCLKVGQPVTLEVLQKYGRNTISLKETSVQNVWLLDFSV